MKPNLIKSTKQNLKYDINRETQLNMKQNLKYDIKRETQFIMRHNKLR